VEEEGPRRESEEKGGGEGKEGREEEVGCTTTTPGCRQRPERPSVFSWPLRGAVEERKKEGEGGGAGETPPDG
jgi:hypothetical protein